MYIVDTNIYIRALRDRAFSATFDEFQQTALPHLWMSAVVAFEVLVGARSEKQAADYERWILRPFRDRGRIIAPTADSWRLVARMDREIRSLGGGGFEAKLAQRAFLDDMLIAACCRQVGATLITDNRVDFQLLNRVVGVRFETSFPVA